MRVENSNVGEAILARIKAAGLAYRSSPIGSDDYMVNNAFGGSLVYWSEPDGHAWEILTVSYERRIHSHGAKATPNPAVNAGVSGLE